MFLSYNYFQWNLVICWGGGILIAVEKMSSSFLNSSNSTIEKLFVSVGNLFWVQYIYHLPLIPIHIICTRFKLKHKRSPPRVFGDYNLPNAVWNIEDFYSTASSYHFSSQTDTEAIENISILCAFHNLFQSKLITKEFASLIPSDAY